WQRGVSREPREAIVIGAKNASIATAGDKKNIPLSVNDETRAARRKCRFALSSPRNFVESGELPRLSTVLGHQYLIKAVNRIAHRQAIVSVAAGDSVIKRSLIFIGELQLPAFAAVHRLVDPRRIAVADTQYICRFCIERFDVAEIKFLGSRHFYHLPRVASVRRAYDRAA